MKPEVQQALATIERLVERFIDNPPENFDVNGLVKDYNIVRRIVTQAVMKTEEVE